MFPLPLHIYFEIGALLTCLFFWSRIKNTKLYWFLTFMLFIVIVELTGRYLKKELGEIQLNQSLYNVSIPIEYLFYAYIFFLHYQNKVFKKIVGIFLIVFPAFVLINIVFFQGFNEYNSNIVKVGSFSMIVFSCFYFSDMMKAETEQHLLKIPMFWIATGVLLFNAGEFLFSLSIDYLYDKFPKEIFKIFGSIIFKLICVLYTCISIAIICSERRHQKV
jgi:hypothetical protein